MTVAYKVNKGSDVFEKLWWNKYWPHEAFKELDKVGILKEFDITQEDIGLSGDRLIIKPKTKAYEIFEESLLKKESKHGYFHFRKNPKNKEVKSFVSRVQEIVKPFYKKENSFIYLDVFGWGNFRSGAIDNDQAIFLCKSEVEPDSKYCDQLESISEVAFYRIKADMLEKNK
ncbi:hypothetical protein CBF34_07130 [Vagococcus penaei]|uniref:hypothetical protein n=1 Tax=Vagococcus penaei TaxID=633807 RepID=UPI000F88E64B|nr:hypothetical protein [Vagococcus penaei]RSU01424.1 hypothetical protein CBF34_07130 [Vagococcus penaei]